MVENRVKLTQTHDISYTAFINIIIFMLFVIRHSQHLFGRHACASLHQLGPSAALALHHTEVLDAGWIDTAEAGEAG